MLKRASIFYIDSFRGFRAEVWWLALITFINRAGTMVLPFLSLYLTDDMGLTLSQVGWIMSVYGLGSLIGSWLGGKLSDSIGFYQVIFGSLICAGLGLILLQFATTFETFCLGVFVMVTLGDAFRPALFVSLRAYSKPENRTRALTLVRLAINLGFTFGPAIGGLIITSIGYVSLFWVDGLTCIGAAFLFLIMLDKKESKTTLDNTPKTNVKSPYRDRLFLLFLLTVTLTGFSFMQYFSTVPLFYRDGHHLSEDTIGLILGLNGLLIFLIEMPLVKYIEHPQFSRFRVLAWSVALFAVSFLVLNFGGWVGLLWIGMVIMTFAEMLNFPLANRFAMDRSERGKAGAYMALFTISWSISHIIGHNAGMQMVDQLGYTVTWYIMTGVLIGSAVLTLWLRRALVKEGETEV